MTGTCEHSRLIPSNITETRVRRRRHSSTTNGGFWLRIVAVAVVSLLAISNVNEVAAFHCENRINPTAVNRFQSPYWKYSCITLSGVKGLTLSESLKSNHRHAQHSMTTVMSTKDDDIAVQQTNALTTKSVNETATMASTSTSSSNRSNLSRTLVLAVPLMLKFALVLMIKFLTDLVVFPLLFTYRGTRILKRRIIKIWNRWTSSTTSPVSPANTEGEALNLENYVANGSADGTKKG